MHSQKQIVVAFLVLSFSILFAVPGADAQGRWQPGNTGSVRIFFGEFVPSGDSMYWDDKFDDFTGSIDDFEDFVFSGDYRLPVNEYSAVLFGMSWYDGSATQGYIDWVDGAGQDVRHLTSLQTWDFSVAWIVEFGWGSSPVRPYFGVGGGSLWYELVETGDFIDFGDPDLPIVRTSYGTSSSTWEWMAIGGLDVRVNPSFSVVLQGRWRDADDELGGGFSGAGNLDLSGYDYSLGFAFHF